MRQIAFKNFRKFANFPPLDLAPITILVGENNAGKSTVVKGILAFSDFLNNRSSNYFDDFNDLFFEDNESLTKEQRLENRKKYLQRHLKNIKFYFNTSYLAHIGTFKRALYNRAENNSITLRAQIGPCTIGVTVTGNPKDEEAVSANVSEIEFSLQPTNISMRFDLFKDKAIVCFNPLDSTSRNNIREKDDRISNYFNSFDKPYSFEIRISDYLEYSLRSDILRSLISSVEYAVNATLFSSKEENEMFISSPRYRRALANQNMAIKDISDETVSFLKLFCRLFYSGRNREDTEIQEFRLPWGRMSFSDSVDIEYIYAHAVTQTVVYSAKDTNDYLSHTIHEYAPLDKINYRHKFITKWMNEFGVGVDFEIKSVGGEAHIVYIKNSDGQKVNLSDKGMGSIQLMVLLFRLAITLPRTRQENRRRLFLFESYKSVFIIEEPEQNLHPMLQSKLADLLFDLHSTYGYRFIVETHSEYLVRRSQVIVGDKFDTEEKLIKNPFKVYYFPSEGNPYDMQYTTSGLFLRKFGEGFINEAGKLHMAVLKNAKKQQ
jgi:predicted ATPase